MTFEPESRLSVRVVEPTEKDATELPLAMVTMRFDPVSITLKSELNWKSVPEAKTSLEPMMLPKNTHKSAVALRHLHVGERLCLNIIALTLW